MSKATSYIMAVWGGALKQGIAVVDCFYESPDEKFEDYKSMYGNIGGAYCKITTKTVDTLQNEVEDAIRATIDAYNATQPDASKHRVFGVQGDSIYDIGNNDVKSVLRSLTGEKSCKSLGKEPKAEGEKTETKPPKTESAVQSKAIAPAPVVVATPVVEIAQTVVATSQSVVAPAKGGRGKKAIAQPVAVIPAPVIAPPPTIPLPPAPVVVEPAPKPGRGRKPKTIEAPVIVDDSQINIPVVKPATKKANGSKQINIDDSTPDSDDAVNA